MLSISQYAFAYLPQVDGYLPSFMLLVAAVALGNTCQAFLGTNTTRRIYSRTPAQVTPLSSRTFGTWTLTSSIVRMYAAYHLREKAVYDIAMWTYFIAFAHFSSEYLVFRTSGLRGPAVLPIIVASTFLTWMFLQYNFYIKP